MGQEWAASTPFLYFTDLEPDLGTRVTAGRREEFKDFPEFSDPARRAQIPDPQAPETFDASRLQWAERTESVHASSLALYTALLHLRRSHPAFKASESAAGDAVAAGPYALVVRREAGAERFYVVVRLRESGSVIVEGMTGASLELVLSTEDPRFAADPVPPRIEAAGDRVSVHFARPGAAILKVS
jgi:maltooligosyltrehalose trehalohydrolase